MDQAELARLRRVADYQFGRGAGRALFPSADLTVHRTGSGRPRQVFADGDRLVSYGTDGRYTLGIAGGHRLEGTCHRVTVGDESEPYVRDGRNAMAKFVRTAEAGIRPGDEVVVSHVEGALLAVGRAELPGDAMLEFETGVAVSVREGAGPPLADGG